MGGGGVWWLLLVAGVGIIVAVAVGLRPGTRGGEGDGERAQSILAERLAAGEIDEREYRERSAVLASDGPKRASWWPAVLAGAAVVLVLLLAGGALAGWFGGPRWGPMHGMPHMQDRSGTTTDGGEVPAPLPDATELTVDAGEMWFAPETLEVTAGDPINLTVINEGQAFHDLVIDELDLRIPVEAGEAVTAGLQIDEPGTYEYYCSVPGHAGAGMRGTLTVETGRS